MQMTTMDVVKIYNKICTAIEISLHDYSFDISLLST